MTEVRKPQADYPYLTLDEIRSLSKDIRGVMVEKGWYETERTREEVGMLIASEVFEAFEDYRDGKMDTYFTDAGKPCGCWSEIADVAIRCLDAMDGLEEDSALTRLLLLEIETVRNRFQDTNLIKLMRDAVLMAINMEFQSHSAKWQGVLIGMVMALDTVLRNFSNTNLRHEIALKMTYNRTRPHRHGGKKL